MRMWPSLQTPGMTCKESLRRAVTNTLHCHEYSNKRRWYLEDWFWQEKNILWLQRLVRCCNRILRGILNLLYLLDLKIVQFIFSGFSIKLKYVSGAFNNSHLSGDFLIWFLWKDRLNYLWIVSFRYFSEENAVARVGK